MTHTLVSIIIPTYGGPKCLDRAITSALNQTYSNIEIIVVDDNGIGTEKQKETAEFMLKYADEPRVNYICHEVNKNGSTARNTGVRNSHGEYVALFDDDDEYCPEKIEKQVEALNCNADVDMVFCSAERYLDGRLVHVDRASDSNNWLYELLMHKQHIQTTSMLMRRTAFEKIGGFDESFRRHQDWEFIARLAAKCKFMPLDIVGYKYHIVRRNRPQSAQMLKELRLFYLEKMKPVMISAGYSIFRQREVVVYNRMEIALAFLKERNYAKLIKELFEIHSPYYGLRFMFDRADLILRRGKLKLTD